MCECDILSNIWEKEWETHLIVLHFSSYFIHHIRMDWKAFQIIFRYTVWIPWNFTRKCIFHCDVFTHSLSRATNAEQHFGSWLFCRERHEKKVYEAKKKWNEIRMREMRAIFLKWLAHDKNTHTLQVIEIV